MAITVAGSAGATKKTAAIGSNSVTVPVPAGAAAGDVAVLLGTSYTVADFAQTSITGGFTKRWQGVSSNNNSLLATGYAGTFAGTPPASITWTFTDTQGGQVSALRLLIAVFRGADQANPVALVGTPQESVQTTPTIPAFTSPTAGVAVGMAVVGNENFDGGPIQPASPWSLLTVGPIGDSSDTSQVGALAQRPVAAGTAYPQSVWTGGGTSDRSFGNVVVLKQRAGGNPIRMAA